jgi:ribosomal protein S18
MNSNKFLSKNLKSRKMLENTKCRKNKQSQPIITNPTKLSWKWRKKYFKDIQMLKKFITTKPALPEMLNRVLSSEN